MGACCCLQTYNLNVNLKGKGLVVGQSWIQINRRILFCPPIIMNREVCCCLHVHSVVNVLVMGLVLGQCLMFISTMSIVLYARVYPLYIVLWECIVVFYT